MITIVFPTKLLMEKKFTLMKTLTAALSALRDLLFSRSKRNFHTVNNFQTSTTGGCETTVQDHFIYANDPGKSGSFLFFNQAGISDQSSIDNGQQATDNDQKLQGKEDPDSHRGNKIND